MAGETLGSTATAVDPNSVGAAIDPAIKESVANCNMKTLGDMSAFLAGLAMRSAMHYQDNIFQQTSRQNDIAIAAAAAAQTQLVGNPVTQAGAEQKQGVIGTADIQNAFNAQSTSLQAILNSQFAQQAQQLQSLFSTMQGQLQQLVSSIVAQSGEIVSALQVLAKTAQTTPPVSANPVTG
jgi:hypothetical protein